MTAIDQEPSLGEAPERYLPVVDLAASPLTKAPSVRLIELAREHSPVFARRLPSGRWSLFAGELAVVDDLSDESRFAKAINPNLRLVREFTGDGLFTAFNSEPNWAKAHAILLPAFARDSMRTYHPIMVRVAQRLIDAWDAAAATDTPVPVADDMTKMTLDTIGLAGFDFDFGSFERDEAHPFVQAMVRGLAYSQTAPLRDPAVDHSEQDAAFRADAEFLAGVVDEVVAERRASGDTSTDDLLGLMLGAPDPATGETLDDANIRNQVITFLIAGHETTSGALSFALYYLAKNPTVLRRAQAEVDALWGDTPDPVPSFGDVGKLRYIRQILNEALRLWPTAPGFARVATVDTSLAGRYPVRAGEVVSVLTPVLHRDPVWGDNVEQFDPERFTPEAIAARPANAYKPFGTGERACIGMQFALHEATMLLGLLVHRYRLLDHADYQLAIKQTLTLKPDDFTLKLLPRTSRTPAAPASAAPSAAAPARVTPDTAVTVLHGSNLGTSREFATGIAELATDLGATVHHAALDSAVAALPAEGLLVIVAASYNGQPTDDAAAFLSWLTSDAARVPAGLRYAVLGIGDRNWAATYQRIPTVIDERLAELGATRLLPRAAADASADLAGAVDDFATALRAVLLREHGDPTAVGGAPEARGYQVREIVGAAADGLAARHGVVPMRVIETGDLADLDHPLGRPKRFLRVELPDGVDYRTADHLSVLPVNDPESVRRAADLLGVDLDTVLDIRAAKPSQRTLPIDRPIRVADLLTHYLELQDQPTAAQLELLAAHNPCPPEAAELRARAAALAATLAAAKPGDPGEAAETGAVPRPGPTPPAAQTGTADAPLPSTLDLIARYPALRGRLPWPVLLELLPAIRVRHYSISSAPSVSPRHVDLMVSLLAAPHRAGAGTFTGVASAYLNRLQPGDTVLARVQPCRESFRIAPDTRTPVIMVSAGTGLAPFRGAIADRTALLTVDSELAPALCYFGCDHRAVDYLHGDELETADKLGAVSMRPTFSRDPEQGREFVQDRIRAEADEVWSLLAQGARVYVCGDGNRMAPGVRDAFQELHRRFTGGDAESARDWWQRLCADGRYVEDVYTSR